MTQLLPTAAKDPGERQIDGVAPDEALAAVLPTCGLTFYQVRGRLIITAQAK